MELKNKNVLFFTKLIVFGALFMMILPFILFGENNYITVHDLSLIHISEPTRP